MAGQKKVQKLILAFFPEKTSAINEPFFCFGVAAFRGSEHPGMLIQLQNLCLDSTFSHEACLFL